MRRNVLLQGEPGTGKSTFCLHAARELSRRTILLTPDGYESMGINEWRKLLEVLAPEMVIVDDIDRVGEHTIEARLRLFEEGYCEVPYSLFTSNDHTRLPRAMRRPGRVDELIRVTPPGEALCDELINRLAERVGVSIPAEERPRLRQLMRERSNAHVIELLRRAQVLGWAQVTFPEDITFELGEEGEDGVVDFAKY